MAITYEQIASNTLSSSTATVTFSSIPQTYTDIVVITKLLAATAGDIRLNFNNDTANNYNRVILSGDTTTTYNSSAYSQAFARFNYASALRTTEPYSMYFLEINQYRNPNMNKAIYSRGGRPGEGNDYMVNMWNSTAAINRIDFSMDFSRSFAAGSYFALYGISAA